MAYGDNTLSADHQWTFNNVLTDNIGSLNLSNVGGNFVTTVITRDSTHSYRTNDRDDYATANTVNDTGLTQSAQYAFGGWFMTDNIQGPPCTIYKQGGLSAGFAIFLWAGNNVMLQTRYNASQNIQIFSDISLTNNRPYHFLVIFSGSGFDNEVSFYIDGVKQLSNLDGASVGDTVLDAHSSGHFFGENGTDGIDVPIGGQQVICKAPVNGFFSQWWTWSGSNATFTDSEILTDIFAIGAIPETTISTGTQVAMQSALDAFSGTTRGDEPLNFLIEDVSGGGNLTLNVDNITFPDRSSMHFVWEGTGLLTLVNVNGSNTSKAVSATGTVIITKSVPVVITVRDIDTNSVIVGARVLLREGTGGTIIINDVTDGSGQVTTNYDFSGDQLVTGRVRKGSSSTFYKTSPIVSTITTNGLDEEILLVIDE